MPTMNTGRSGELLAVAAENLSSKGQYAPAFVAAILSRFEAARTAAGPARELSSSAYTLQLVNSFASDAEALQELTEQLYDLMPTGEARDVFKQECVDISLPGIPVSMDLGFAAAAPASSAVFRKLASKLAADGFAVEAGAALEQTTIAAWVESHMELYPPQWRPLILVVLDELIHVAGLPSGQGHTEVWKALQLVRFAPLPTPLALAGSPGV